MQRPARIIAEPHTLPVAADPLVNQLEAAAAHIAGAQRALSCCILFDNSVLAGAPGARQAGAKCEAAAGDAFLWDMSLQVGCREASAKQQPACKKIGRHRCEIERHVSLDNVDCRHGVVCLLHCSVVGCVGLLLPRIGPCFKHAVHTLQCWKGTHM